MREPRRERRVEAVERRRRRRGDKKGQRNGGGGEGQRSHKKEKRSSKVNALFMAHCNSEASKIMKCMCNIMLEETSYPKIIIMALTSTMYGT
ncbi:hypothetical protein HN873_001287 [Arachis hypogaea]